MLCNASLTCGPASFLPPCMERPRKAGHGVGGALAVAIPIAEVLHLEAGQESSGLPLRQGLSMRAPRIAYERLVLKSWLCCKWFAKLP